MKNAIEIKNLVKKYDSKFELNIPKLEIPSGRIVGLIGENGAGKTTLIKSLLNLIKVNTGSIKIFDKDSLKEEAIIKEDIGIVLDGMFLPEILNAQDVNKILKDIYKNWEEIEFFRLLEDFEIPLNKKIKELSKGMRKKLEIATALSHHAKLLILDEATSGIDPVVREEILDLLLKFVMDEEHTVLLSTHITSELEYISDNIIFMDHGKIILEDSRDNIMENYAILKCDKAYLEKIDKEDIITYKNNRFDCQVLVNDVEKIKKKYKDNDLVFDKITLQDLMVLMIKGERE